MSLSQWVQALQKDILLMLDLGPPFPGLRIGTYRIPVALLIMSSLVVFGYIDLSRMLKNEKWVIEGFTRSLSTGLLIGCVLGFTLATSRTAKLIAKSADLQLTPTFQLSFIAGFMIHLMTASLMLVAGILSIVAGMQQLVLMLILVWIAIGDVATRSLRALLVALWLGVVVAILGFMMAVPNAVFSFGDTWLFKLQFLFAFWAVVMTSVALWAAILIRPLIAIPCLLLWIAALVQASDNFLTVSGNQHLRILYDQFAHSGVHLFTVAASIVFVIWTLLRARESALGGQVFHRGLLSGPSFRDTLRGLVVRPYEMQLSAYVRRGWGGQWSLLTLGLGPRLHVGTAWIMTIGSCVVCMAAYASGYFGLLERGGALLVLQWILLAVLLCTMHFRRDLASRSAELGILFLLPGAPCQLRARRVLGQVVFFAIFAAGLPMVLAFSVLVNMPVIPDYPHITQYTGLDRTADYWTVSVLILLLACMSAWIGLNKSDWRVLKDQKDWLLGISVIIVYSSTLLSFSTGLIGPILRMILIFSVGVACVASFSALVRGPGNGWLPFHRLRLGRDN